MNGDVVAQAAEALADWDATHEAGVEGTIYERLIKRAADALLGSSDAVTLYRVPCDHPHCDNGRCVCNATDGCCGEGYEPDDPRTCRYCLELDSEWPCPAEVPCSSCGGSGSTIEATETEQFVCCERNPAPHERDSHYPSIGSPPIRLCENPRRVWVERESQS